MAGIINGQTADADEVMNAIGSNFADTAQMIFNADYIGFDSRLFNSGVPNLKNVVYDACTSPGAYSTENIIYNDTDDLYETFFSENEYVIVTASSLSGGFTDNNCVVRQMSDTTWLVYCTSGTDEVRRASILATLFYNERISNFTSITKLETSHTGDVGKRAYKRYNFCSSPNAGDSMDVTDTFVNTTTNTEVNIWQFAGVTSNGVSENSLEMPVATTLIDAPGTGTSSSIATDTTAWDTANPDGVKVHIIGTGSTARTAQQTYFLLTKGALTEGTVNVGGDPGETSTFTDYYGDGVPEFTQADFTSTATLIFQTSGLDTVTNCIAIINSIIDADNTLTVSISADGTNYETVTSTNIHRFTNTGTNLYIKFEIARVDTAAADKITEYAIKYNFY